MLLSYFKIAIRNLLRNRVISIINVAGLAVSMACAILIFMWIQDEKSFDAYHDDVDRIYRVAVTETSPIAEHSHASVTGALAVALRENYPQIEHIARILPQPGKVIQVGPEQKFNEKNFFIVDDDFFDIFTLPFVYGSAEDAFQGSKSIVISERIAKKYFGDTNPLGHVLWINNNEVTVTGVVIDTPRNSHLQFDILAPLKPVEKARFFSDWTIRISIYTFIKLKPGIDAAEFEKSIAHIANNYIGEELTNDNMEKTYFLQPMRDIYLYSELESEAPVHGNAFYVYVFNLTALIIVLIAGINFINLTTSRSLRRGKEVAVRKVVGAGKSHIIRQLLFEIMIMVLISLALAIIMSEVSIPVFNNLTGKEFQHFEWLNPGFVISAFGLILLVSLICAAYPVWIYASFTPQQVFKKMKFSDSGTFSVRKLLVIMQFALSIALIAGTLTVFRQMHFVRNMDMGFNSEQKLIIPIRAERSAGLDFYEQAKQEFINNPSISNACMARAIPGVGGLLSFDVWLVGQSDNKLQPMEFSMIDNDYLQIFDIPILAGRTFSSSPADIYHSVVINETARKAFGFNSNEEALGKAINPGYETETPLTIIGVSKDVHYESLHTIVRPLYFALSPEWFKANGQNPFRYIVLTVQTSNLTETLGFVKSKHQQLFPGRNFEYFFLDEQVQQQYIRDEQFAMVFNIFTGFAILISCVGLLGLAIFNAEQRVKEIGLRKVLGASVPGIVLHLSGDFIKWVLLANIFAWPASWYAMNKWLQGFAYRVDPGIWPFLLAGVLALVIALLTTSGYTVKAASADPVDALRYE